MTKIRSSINLAKLTDREAYKESLETLLGNIEAIPQHNLNDLKVKLKTAAENARPIDDINMVLCNRMQFAALLALEAEFFVAIQGKITPINRQRYLDLHKELFGSDSDFEKSIKLFIPLEKTLYKDSSLEYKSFDAMSSIPDVFEQKLKFTETTSRVFATKKDVELGKADIKTLESFMLNIDPRIMAYIVACNSDGLKINFQNFTTGEMLIDICHEYILSTYALCCTLVDTTALIIPPAALSVGVLYMGASLPITVGVGICIFGLELVHLNKNASNQVFSPMTSHIINQHLQTSIQGALDDSTRSVSPTFLQQPVQFFDFIGMAKELGIFMSNAYAKHKLDFTRKAPELVESFDSLVQIKYDLTRRSLSKTEDKIVKDHLGMFGIKLEQQQ